MLHDGEPLEIVILFGYVSGEVTQLPFEATKKAKLLASR
jgi:hypothetical protein